MRKRKTSETVIANRGSSLKRGRVEPTAVEAFVERDTPIPPSPPAENEDELATGDIALSNHGFEYKIRFGSDGEARRRSINDDSDSSGDASSVTSWDEFEENADSFQWLEPIEGRAYESGSTGSKRIATCEANFILRDDIRIRFQETMDELENTAEFASELFDRHGRLKEEYVQHEIRKGSGIWGHELDKGNIVLFDTIKVDARFHRWKIASDLVQEIWTRSKSMWSRAESPETQICAFAYASHIQDDAEHVASRGGFLSAADLARSFAVGQAKSAVFLRALGFRRVGNTHWFCISSDLDHPCHKLAASDDYNPAELAGEDDPNYDTLPCHKAVQTMDNIQCAMQLDCLLSDPLSNNHLDVLVGSERNSLLHLAALNRLPLVVNILLGRFGHELEQKRNADGYTPLEALETDLEKNRVLSRPISFGDGLAYDFKGWDDEDVACLSLLKWGHRNPSPYGLEAYRYGCSCGQCIGGFLSNRMKFFLQQEATMLAHETPLVIDACGAEDWVKYEPQFKGLSAEAKAKLMTDEIMQQGYVRLLNHVEKCLRSGKIPTESNVSELCSEEETGTKRLILDYLKKGGTILSAVLPLFERAVDHNEFTGDGMLQEFFGQDIEELPVCRNDYEFGLVLRKCGFDITPGH